MNLNWNSEFVRFLWIGRQGRYCYNSVFVIGTERFKSGVGGLPNRQQRPTSRRARSLPLLSVNPHTHSAFIPYIYFICVKGFDVYWWEFLISERKRGKIKIAGILENSAVLYVRVQVNMVIDLAHVR